MTTSLSELIDLADKGYFQVIGHSVMHLVRAYQEQEQDVSSSAGELPAHVRERLRQFEIGNTWIPGTAWGFR